MEVNKQSSTKALVIYGENDSGLGKCKTYWRNYSSLNSGFHYKEVVIKDADHSFFGWQFKKDVCNAMTSWITTPLADQISL
ncbi:MAG: hypothetical protein EOO46_17275 [Flavobacterium sp.]|nr:MAG: hypothetical protein EOO46_17275 [Flavobacterium sp.]